jgi:hypothetical protein
MLGRRPQFPLVLLSRKAHGPLANFMLARRGCDLVGVKIPTF